MTSWFGDPLLIKELRTRLRARTAMLVVLLQSLVFCVIVGLFALSQYGAPAWEVGEGLFQILLYVQTMMLFFLAPLVAASVISGEKEQKTYDSLLVTPVSACRLILCKLASALAVFLVLLAIALPFAVGAYLLGGVPFGRLVVGWLYVLVLMTVSGVTGVYWSTRFGRSIAAIPAAAICTVLLGVLYPILASEGPAMLAWLSPVLFLGAFLEGQPMPFFGIALPGGVLVFVFLLLVGASFAAAAIERIKPEEDRRYVVMRGLSLLALVTLAAGVVGGLAGQGRMPNDVMIREKLSGIWFALFIPLLFLAPWCGASMPVIRSQGCGERHCRAGGRCSRFAFCQRLLLGPFGYVSVLGLIGVGLLWVSQQVLGLRQDLPGGASFFLGAALVLCPAAYAMLAYRLADRQRTRNRFLGLGVACGIMFVLLVVPLILFFVGRGGMESAQRPLVWDLYSLTSPFTAVTIYGASSRQGWLQALGQVRGLLGEAGVWVVAPAWHALVLGILLLPVYPSWRRRMQASADQG